MENPVGEVFGKISGRWALNLEFRFPRIELDEKRIASSKPSLGFSFF